VKTVPIEIPTAVMMHDFSITSEGNDSVSIFLDLPLEFSPKEMLKSYAYFFNNKRPSRIGVLPRYGESKSIEWFEFNPGYIFHTVNSFHATNSGKKELFVMGCRAPELDLKDVFTSSNDKPALPSPYCYRINQQTGEKSEYPLSDVECEFPSIHPKLVGKPFRYAFCATFSGFYRKGPLFDGVIKFDASECGNGGPFKEVARIHFGTNRFGGESIFVPRKNERSEDDGFLLTFVFDENTQKSEFVVFDAKTMNPKPVLQVKLPQRVPYGFHGIWVEEDQIRNQKELPL